MIRLVSAAALAVVLGLTLWAAPLWATGLLAAVAAALAGVELARMASKVGEPVPSSFVAAAAAVMVIAFGSFDPGGPAEQAEALAAATLALVVAAGVVNLALGPPGPGVITRIGAMVMGPLYVGAPLGALVAIHCQFGPRATSWLIAIIATSDSSQYYTGRLFGRRKLAPVISPGKTVEGAVGGLVIATAAGALLGPLCLPQLPRVTAAGLALALAAFGIAGDLFESLLKRSAGVKDSSHIIPGHGGVLDRIDSYLFAAPVFYFVLRRLAS